MCNWTGVTVGYSSVAFHSKKIQVNNRMIFRPFGTKILYFLNNLKNSYLSF